MVKCFLSHSSKDKKSYVEIVARKLGYHNCVYDEFTFEEGMKSLDEILKGLELSAIFVIFISESSMISDWVKLEITEAQRSFEEGEIILQSMNLPFPMPWKEFQPRKWKTAFRCTLLQGPEMPFIQLFGF